MILKGDEGFASAGEFVIAADVVAGGDVGGLVVVDGLPVGERFATFEQPRSV